MNSLASPISKLLLGALALILIIAGILYGTSGYKMSGTKYTYSDSRYSFQLNPGGDWSGYKVVVKKADPSDTVKVDRYAINVPTTDQAWPTSENELMGYAAPAIISIYTVSDWDAMQGGDGPMSTYIAKNANYVATYSTWQDSPVDLRGKFSMDDFTELVSSFKFTQ